MRKISPTSKFTAGTLVLRFCRSIWTDRLACAATETVQFVFSTLSRSVSRSINCAALTRDKFFIYFADVASGKMAANNGITSKVLGGLPFPLPLIRDFSYRRCEEVPKVPIRRPRGKQCGKLPLKCGRCHFFVTRGSEILAEQIDFVYVLLSPCS